MDNNNLMLEDKNLVKLYQRNVSSVYKMCYIYLKNTADAEDAVQSVFLKFLQAGVSFNDQDHEKAWFITTTRNYCKDVLKSWWRRQRIDLETLPEIVSQDDTEREKEIIISLMSLPEKYKSVLHLYYLENYSVKEIAELLKINESTIRTRLQRGREKLKIHSGGNYYEQECYN